LLLAGSVLASTGCAATVRKAAKDAGPAAVESSLKTAHDPVTRNQIAEVLADPEIRGSMAQLSQSVTDGVLNSLTEKERVGRAEAAGDAFVEHMSTTLARSLERDFAPALSNLVADSVQRSLERSLDDQVQARVELMARAAARGSVEGAAEGLNARLGQSGPALDGLVQHLSRTAGREAALGFRDAVATSAAERKAGTGPGDDVLAAAGRTSGALLVAFRLAAWLLVIAVSLLALATSVWALRRLRRPPGPRGTHTHTPAPVA
jgi:hypothetical protein